MQGSLRETIAALIRASINKDVLFSVEFPEDALKGDYTSNVALLLAKKNGGDPKEIAVRLAEKLKTSGKEIFADVRVAGAGFVNFILQPSYIQELLATGIDYIPPANGKKASVEFVSANPTGPLHIGNARGGPIGDTIANLLELQAFQVKREYFHNDAGAQVAKFRDALWKQYQKSLGKEINLDEIEYKGAYVEELARDGIMHFEKTLTEENRGPEKLIEFAFDELFKKNFDTLREMGIHFDLITKESELLPESERVIGELAKMGRIIEKEHALWFTFENNGVREEAVVKKSDGTLLYFANDIAYHKRKFEQNDLVIDVLGEGHHGHIPKLRAIAEAFNYPQEQFKVAVHGQVQLIRGGEKITMSKREGNFVAAEEVLREVGRDAFRYFLLSYSPRSQMQFDLDLARERSKKNPVFYVQYAHARASSILSKSSGPEITAETLRPLSENLELRLALKILQWPEIVADTINDFELQRLTRYAYELARDFTQFYESLRVIGEGEDVERARLALVSLTRARLQDVLKLIGVGAPQEM